MRDYKQVTQYQSESTTEILDRNQQARSIFDPPLIKRDRRKRFRTHYWADFSPKIGRYVGLYRNIGYDHWVWIEVDPSIPWFTDRPIPIRLRSGSRDESHRFDMVLETTDAIECRRLFDVDSLADLSGHELDDIDVERAWCESLGYRYRIITNADLRPYRILIENWKTMLSYIREPHPGLAHRVLGYVSAVGELTLGEIWRLLADIDLTRAKGVVFGLLHRGRLVAPDLVISPISSTTNVRIRHD
jgi:hypothetical protein